MYETEVLAILSGLEIDAAKTGVRPDLSDYLGKKIPRTPFLKYKTMVEAAEMRREWYEDTHQQKMEKLFAGTDWEKVVAYYLANKPEDSDWVVLPSTNFNCYFGSTVFSKKVLKEITGKVIRRSDTSYGSGRYRVLEEFL